jgi:hypothetical protein
MAKYDPGNVQFSAGSKKNSEEVNKGRLIPSFRALGLFADDTGFDPDDATASIIRLGNMVVRISGSYTAGAFRTNAIKFFINDDCELVTDIAGIGTPADGARSRIRGIEGAQLASISRPDKWASPHHRDVVTGTLEFLMVPCPHCGTFQELTLKGESLVDQLRIENDPTNRNGPAISPPLAYSMPRLGRLQFGHCKLLPGLDAAANPGGWDYNRIVAETYYECVCGCRINQDDPLTDADLANPLCSFSDEVRALHADGVYLTHKQAMVLSGRHVSANPNPIPADGGGPRSKRSEHNSDLVSLDFDMTWGHLAKKFAERAHDPAALRNFLAEHCGLPFWERNILVTDRDLIECRAPYERGTLPWVPDLVTICADTQDAWWKFVVAAARLDTAGEAWRDIAVIHWGVAILKSDMLATLRGWRDPQTGELRPYSLQADPSRTFTPRCGLIDAGGHRTDEVYELHFDSNKIFYPSYGRDDKTAQLRPTWQRPIAEAWRGATFDICWYWDDFWQRRLVSSIRQVREIKACTEIDKLDPSARGLPPRLWIPGLPQDGQLREFEKELLNETLIDGEWKKLGPQDFRDALKECFASFDLALPAAVAQRAARKKADTAKSET